MVKAKDRPKLQDVTLRFTNSKSREVSFVLEPWGEIYSLKPADEIVVVFRGPPRLEPEIDLEDETITAYGWTGSYASVFKNGEEVRSGMSDSHPPVPPIPNTPTPKSEP